MEPDEESEPLHTLTAATKFKWLPRRRKGKRPHLSTFLRWIQTGVNGVKLPAVRVGGTWCVTESAIRKFFDEVAAGSQPTQLPQLPAARRDAIRRADATLDKAGIR